MRPPLDANGVGHGGDDLDEVLSAFFRSEMPSPWPQLQLPEQASPARPPVRLARPAPAPSSRPWLRSPRFALAASVALLIGGYALMPAALPPPSPPDNPSLDRANLKDSMPRPIDDDGVDVKIESLDQIGNAPGTIHIQVFEKK
jgi:hypothetical protein